ncbi:MAG: hypothetical protein AAGA23_17340 [Pseudomonadota bacterium]
MHRADSHLINGPSQEFYDALVEREENVIAVHCLDIEEALVQFRVMCRRSGRSVYHWSGSHGLVSMKASDISVPGSRKLTDALRYVLQSMHYGVYVFSGFAGQLQHSSVEYLRSIAGSRDGYQRKVILLGKDLRLPGVLSDTVYQVFERERTSLRPRLRDGRWIVS